MAFSNTVSKREWQKPEVTALKVDLRSVAQGNGKSTDIHKNTTPNAS